MTICVKGNLLEMGKELTETYRRYEHAHPAIREAMCLRVQYPAVLPHIHEEDLFAGKVHFGENIPAIGFVMSVNSPDIGFVCSEERLRNRLQALGAEDLCSQEMQELLDFWKGRTSSDHFWERVITDRPENLRRALPDRLGPSDFGEGRPMIAGFGDRMATATLNWDKLLRLGIPGMFAEVERHRAQAEQEGENGELFQGLRLCLELLVEVCRWYASQAREKGMIGVAHTLETIIISPPSTLREAIQLFWIYGLLAQADNYGRMDVYFGDFVARDVDSGRLSEAEALAMVETLWGMIASLCGSNSGAGRVLIGGLGRRNEENADRFALLAMEATRRTRVPNPVLTLRMFRGMNPALFEKALKVLGEGLPLPLLVNDDVNVPALQCAFSCSREEAAQYVISNCGDVGLDHLSFGSPNSFINVAKALELTLHNGVDPTSGQPTGLPLGEFRNFATFDDLWQAYCTQVEFFVAALADRTEVFNEVLGENAFLFASMLNDDCLERGKPVFAGGLRYLGGLLETYGNITAADALTAIKDLVYHKRLLTQEQLLAALDANFVGYEKARALMLKVPKFGNDDSTADAMAASVNEHLFKVIWEQKQRTNLDFFLAEYVNAGGNVDLGKATAASADGRLAGAPLANANNPNAGYDRNGPTALLNSMAKLDVSLIGPGVFQSIQFSRELFTSSRDKISTLLKTFFDNGGSILQVMVLGRHDLEQALKEPEKYQNLVVRVGGFCARFVELDRSLQLDILKRTVY